MDTFFTQTNCDRCGKPLTGGRTMSMFNTDTICLECADAERKRADS
jgi:formylmethanofuran dehydrogenase subunit E